MADVRALLRNELAARQGQGDSKSTTTRVSKKRKLGPESDDIRKKPRSTERSVPDEQDQVGDVQDLLPAVKAAPGAAEDSDLVTTTPQDTSPSRQEAESQAVDEDEWAAFEREVVEPSRAPLPPPSAAVGANATISAAPVSASDLAAQERQDRESRLAAQEAETLGDREDAARYWEEEFDTMDQLEERVRKLKEKRDEIRQRKDMGKDAGTAAAEAPVGTEKGPILEPEESGEESDVEDEWDDWRFRSRPRAAF